MPGRYPPCRSTVRLHIFTVFNQYSSSTAWQKDRSRERRADGEKKNRREKKPADTIPKKKIQRVNPDYRYGLTKEQIKERLDGGWTNIEVDATSVTVKEIIKKNVLTYFNLIFAVLTVLLCLVGAIRELSFLPIVVINTVVGIIQEIRAKNILEK